MVDRLVAHPTDPVENHDLMGVHAVPRESS
jgi:hypothetical protein